MDLIMTMFKTKTSMSPVKVSRAKKRATSEGNALTNSNNNDSDSQSSSQAKSIKLEEKKFTFEEVKSMLSKLTEDPAIAKASVNSGLKHVNFDEVSIPGHSVQGCKDLVERLVKRARRVRTLHEVLTDIRDNLEKRTYTEIIHRASLDGVAPKRPPSAYLLYHQDRYNELKHDFPLAAEVSKIVSEEWKNMNAKKRSEYQNRHAKLVKDYETAMRQLGLTHVEAPKRPKSARNLYIENRIAEYKHNDRTWTEEEWASLKEAFGREFDTLDKDDKDSWLQHHSEKQQQYKKEKAEYVSAHPHLNHHLGSGGRTVKQENKVVPPELPKSPWKFFLQKKMPDDLAGKAHEEKKKQLKEKFNSLSEKKLLKFIKKAVRDKQRYDEELEQFLTEYPDFKIPQSKPSIQKEQWKIYLHKVENKPNLPAPTAYLHYCGKTLSEMYTDHSDNQPPTQRMLIASHNWNQLSAEEKDAAEREHIESIKTYISQMESWLGSQPEERTRQIISDDPKSDPAYWRKRLNRLLKKREKPTKTEV